MRLADLTIELGVRTLIPATRMAGRLKPKLRRAVAGADTALAGIREWASRAREPHRPLVWLHAPSVGEALMAQAIAAELRRARPDLQVYFTHVSPSAERVRDQVGADAAGYMPWDTRAAMRTALELLAPSAVVFVRTDVWPTLTRAAVDVATPVLLLNAVLAARSSRLKPLARQLLQPAYQRLTSVGAVSAGAARRFVALGVATDRIRVTGDARFDQVWQRVRRIDRASPLLQQLQDARFTVVAGSTWPADEKRLLPAFAALARERAARLIIAPHEPTGEHLDGLERAAQHHQLHAIRLSRLQDHHGVDVIVVDRLGLLADLYALAQLAYVGGAFHRSGVHSVVEPAALGVPVIFGPEHHNAVEAGELISAGAATAVHTGDEVTQALLTHAQDPRERELMGSAARSFVLSRVGGANANAQLVLSVLPGVP